MAAPAPTHSIQSSFDVLQKFATVLIHKKHRRSFVNVLNTVRDNISARERHWKDNAETKEEHLGFRDHVGSVSEKTHKARVKLGRVVVHQAWMRVHKELLSSHNNRSKALSLVQDYTTQHQAAFLHSEGRSVSENAKQSDDLYRVGAVRMIRRQPSTGEFVAFVTLIGEHDLKLGYLGQMPSTSPFHFADQTAHPMLLEKLLRYPGGKRALGHFLAHPWFWVQQHWMQQVQEQAKAHQARKWACGIWKDEMLSCERM